MSTKNQTSLVDWIYEGETYNPCFPIDAYGFTYKITYDNGMTYYGKKSFWKVKTLQPLKGYKRKRRSMVESDWKTYTGSTKSVPKEVKVTDREILSMGKGKVHLTYLETKLLFENDVLFDGENYNGNILGKFYDNADKRTGEWIKYYEKLKEDNDR